MDGDLVDHDDRKGLPMIPDYGIALQRKYPHTGDFFRALEALRHYVQEKADEKKLEDDQNAMNLDDLQPYEEEGSENSVQVSSCFDDIEHEVHINNSKLKAIMKLPNKGSAPHSVSGHVIGVEGDKALIVIYHEVDGDTDSDKSPSYYVVLCDRNKHLPGKLRDAWKAHNTLWANFTNAEQQWEMTVPIQTLEVLRDKKQAFLIHDGPTSFKHHICDDTMRKNLSNDGLIYYKYTVGKNSKYSFRCFKNNLFFNLPTERDTTYFIQDDFTLSPNMTREAKQQVKRIASIARFSYTEEVQPSEILHRMKVIHDSISDSCNTSYDKCLQFALSGMTLFSSTTGRLIPCKLDHCNFAINKCHCDMTWIGNSRISTKMHNAYKHKMQNHK